MEKPHNNKIVDVVEGPDPPYLLSDLPLKDQGDVGNEREEGEEGEEEGDIKIEGEEEEVLPLNIPKVTCCEWYQRKRNN